MHFCISMPGGSEWIVVIFFLLAFLLLPILVVVLFMQNRSLKKQVAALTAERKLMLDKLLDDK